MADFQVLTGYIFTLMHSVVDTINSNFLLQFGVLIVFSYFAVSVLRKAMGSDDDKEGGVKI